MLLFRSYFKPVCTAMMTLMQTNVDPKVKGKGKVETCLTPTILLVLVHVATEFVNMLIPNSKSQPVSTFYEHAEAIFFVETDGAGRLLVWRYFDMLQQLVSHHLYLAKCESGT